MKALKLIYESSYDPDTLDMLAEVFDEVWYEVSDHYGANDTPTARLQLARILLAEYRDGIDAARLKQLVLQKARSAVMASQMSRTA